MWKTAPLFTYKINQVLMTRILLTEARWSRH